MSGVIEQAKPKYHSHEVKQYEANHLEIDFSCIRTMGEPEIATRKTPRHRAVDI